MQIKESKQSKDSLTNMNETEIISDISDEYLIVKYLLTIIPIYLSFLLFMDLNVSVLGLVKIMAGYTVVFSLFILADEKMFIYTKKNINKMFIATTLLVVLALISLALNFYLDLKYFHRLPGILVELSTPLSSFEVIGHFLNKMLFSSFLLIVTFYINIIILTVIIKLDIANKILSGYHTKD